MRNISRLILFAFIFIFVLVGLITTFLAVDDVGLSASAVNPVNISGGTVTSCTYVLDAGHGGSDSGAVNGSRYEKNDNLRMTKRVGELLTASGVAVGYTRVTDTDVSLGDRVSMQKAVNAPYFVSFHRNSYSDPSAHGLEIWRYTGSSTGLALENSVLNPLKALNLFTLRGSNGDQQTTSLAVIKNTTCPAILIELGFISNSGDNTALDNNFESIAQAIASGLCSHIGKTLNTGSSGSAVASRSTRFKASKDSYFDQYTSYQITTSWQNISALADNNHEWRCPGANWSNGVFWLESDDTIYVYWDLGDTYNFSQVRMYSALQGDHPHSSLSSGMDVYWSFAGANESYGSEYGCTSFDRYDMWHGDVTHNTGAIYYYTADMTNIRYIRVSLHSQNAKRIYIADFELTSTPVISDVQVSNVSSAGYTVSCTAKDPNGITDVKMPTWTDYNGQDDLHEWPVASRNGNTFTYNVRSGDHNNETGRYITHIYAYNSLGTASSANAVDIDVNSYYIDVNGYINGDYWTAPAVNYGTFDLTVGGKKVAEDAKDLCETYIKDSSYTLDDIKNGTGYKYIGNYVDTSSSSTAPGYDKRNSTAATVSGTLSSSRQIVLYYETTYTVNYNSNGGSSVSASNAYWSQEFTLPAAPTKTGYTFTGWKIGDKTYNAGAKVSKLSSAPGGAVSATAQWKIKQFDITFSADENGVVNAETVKADYGTPYADIQMPAYTASDGYHFKEWRIVSGSLGENGTIVENIEVKAIFELDPFTPGDINTDTDIDSLDALLIIRCAAGKITFNAAQRAAADLDGDGEGGTSDAALILKLDAGLIDNF